MLVGGLDRGGGRLWLLAWWSFLESGDLGEVLGQDAVAAPGSGSFDAGEVGAGPAVLAFQAGDAALGSCSPADEFSTSPTPRPAGEETPTTSADRLPCATLMAPIRSTRTDWSHRPRSQPRMRAIRARLFQGQVARLSATKASHEGALPELLHSSMREPEMCGGSGYRLWSRHRLAASPGASRRGDHDVFGRFTKRQVGGSCP